MTEEEEDSGNAQRSGSIGQDPDPEIDQDGAVVQLQEMADRMVVKNLQLIIDVVVANMRLHRHLPSINLLFEIAGRLNAGKVVPAVMYESLAETLWKAHNQQLEAAAMEHEAVAGSQQSGD